MQKTIHPFNEISFLVNVQKLQVTVFVYVCLYLSCFLRCNIVQSWKTTVNCNFSAVSMCQLGLESW